MPKTHGHKNYTFDRRQFFTDLLIPVAAIAAASCSRNENREHLRLYHYFGDPIIMENDDGTIYSSKEETFVEYKNKVYVLKVHAAKYMNNSVM